MEAKNGDYIDEDIWSNKENIRTTNQQEIATLGVFPLLTSVILSTQNLPKTVVGTTFCVLVAGTILFFWHLRLKGKGLKSLDRQLHRYKLGKIEKMPKWDSKGRSQLLLLLAGAIYFFSFLLTVTFVFLG